MAQAFGHHPCAISFNEFLGHGHSSSNMPTRFADTVEAVRVWDYVRPSLWANRQNDMLHSVLNARSGFCRRIRRTPDESPRLDCGKRCVVVLKVFSHMSSNRTSLAQLMAYKGTYIVVNERDPNDILCSLKYLSERGMNPHGMYVDGLLNMPSNARPDHLDTHQSWASL